MVDMTESFIAQTMSQAIHKPGRHSASCDSSARIHLIRFGRNRKTLTELMAPRCGSSRLDEVDATISVVVEA